MLTKFVLAMLGVYSATALQLTAGDCSGQTCTGRDMVNNYQAYYCAEIDPTDASCTGSGSSTADAATSDDAATDSATADDADEASDDDSDSDGETSGAV